MTTPSAVHGQYPRVYLVRHGTTEWSLNGRHTGLTDIPLLPSGIEQAKLLSSCIFENPYQDMVHIDNITLVLVSPLSRAQQTYQQLWEGGLANEKKSGNDSCFTQTQARTSSLLTEWDYGDYEGVTTKEILKTRPSWSLFGDNAPNGETVEQVSARCDAIIELIHNYQRGVDSQGNATSVLNMPFTELELKENTSLLRHTEEAEAQAQIQAQAQAFVQENGSLANTKTIVTIPQSKGERDVLIVAHGHFLRVFAARWLKMDGLMGRNFVLDTASVSVLGYEHTLEERVIKVWNQGNHLWKNQTRVG
ncbi:phosphoglycerate mutase 2 [Podila minutissima]|uniref:Phosphoglycerate mutase 2 n=1 Tax=Podila minutissima TaxID=64525 RepID=A0A9P5VPF4_9FUNG|nr:phosphoglycerate mutase 2 [Podila minutissima]